MSPLVSTTSPAPPQKPNPLRRFSPCQMLKTISQLDVARLMLDELKRQARELNHRLLCTRPPEPVMDIREIWLTAKTFTYKLREKGYAFTPNLLRKWAEWGKYVKIPVKNDPICTFCRRYT